MGLSLAGFEHIALVEYKQEYCATLKRNRPNWNVVCSDVRDFLAFPIAIALICWPEVYPVHRSLLRENSWVLMMSVTCSRKPCGL